MPSGNNPAATGAEGPGSDGSDGSDAMEHSAMEAHGARAACTPAGSDAIQAHMSPCGAVHPAAERGYGASFDSHVSISASPASNSSAAEPAAGLRAATYASSEDAAAGRAWRVYPLSCVADGEVLGESGTTGACR